MKNKKSKKPLIVVAMILMIGLVAGMGAMTYSRYITSGTTGDQTATAAKWGFVVTVNATDLFATDYSVEEGATLATKATGDGVAVNASGDANVVAPGTKGSMTISISGSAEVLAKLSITATKNETSTDKATEIQLGDYYPVVWTLKEAGSTSALATGKLSKVLDSLAGTSATFDAGFLYSKTYTLSWEWALETGADANAKATNNAKDTLIGYKAEGKAYADIKDLYCGSTKLGTLLGTEDEAAAKAYGEIVTQMSFNLQISVEQIQS